MPEDRFAPPATADRRSWMRYPCHLETLYQPGDGRLDQPWWFAKVRDLSCHGIGLILTRSLEKGDRLTIALYSPGHEVSRTLEALVAHVAQEQDGTWVIGCAFLGEISEDELRAFSSEQRLSQVAAKLS